MEICQINLSKINSNVVPLWVNLLMNSGEKFEFESKEEDNYYGRSENIYVTIRNIYQLELLRNYGLSDVAYRGWFAHELSNDEIESENIIWAGNKSKRDGTRFGIKIDGDRMYRIAMNRGSTFVYLDSSSDNTLEHFLGQEVDEIEQEYETDSEYGDDGRDYDD